MLQRSYRNDTFDLSDLDLHNGIEHDASLTRTWQNHLMILCSRTIIGEDSALVPDQSRPNLPLVRELLASASGIDQDGNPLLTRKDLSDALAKRRVQCRASNPHFSNSFFHKMFGSSKYLFLF